MRHAVSLSLHAYWDALRAGRAAPSHDALDPAAIGALLPFTFVLGDPGLGGARLRLSGTRLDALFGRDLRGTPFRDLWTPRTAALADRALAAALTGPAAVCASVRGAPPGRTPSAFELLLLPLRGRRCALGALATEPVPGWAGLISVAGLDMASFRTLDGPRRQRDGAPTHLDPPRPAVSVGHLRVYRGGRDGAERARLG